MAPQVPSVSRQYGLISRLTVSVPTQLARLPRSGRGVSFLFPRPNKTKELCYGYADLVVDRIQLVCAGNARAGPGGFSPQVPRSFRKGSAHLECGLDFVIISFQRGHLFLLG